MNDLSDLFDPTLRGYKKPKSNDGWILMGLVGLTVSGFLLTAWGLTALGCTSPCLI